jgi:hypothetical protein
VTIALALGRTRAMNRLLVALGVAVVTACGAACNTPSAAGGSGAAYDGGDRDGSRFGIDGGDAKAQAAALALDAGNDDVGIPPTSSEELTARAKHLLEAITQDNPELAADVLFPRDGFIAARDVADAAKVWEKKVSGVFKKQVHQLHKRKGIDRAQFVSLELGHSVMQATPRRHDWKKPLWKVKHSKLTFTIDGKPFRVDVGEMTAWRGAWYVTRLRGA